MIEYNQSDLLQNGFECQETLVDGLDSYLYRGKRLLYELLIDGNQNQVSISGDTKEPFGSESMYEFYIPCKMIVYASKEEIGYRDFHLSFYDSVEKKEESLVLTVSCRKSDGELVVWPYFKWRTSC